MANAKKARPLFFRNKEVVAQKKKLAELKRKYRLLIKEINTLVDVYHENEFEDSDEWLSKLPIQSLSDLYKFLSGKKDDYSLSKMDLRSRLRKEHALKIEEFIALEREIHINEIDIVLSKIKCVKSKLD